MVDIMVVGDIFIGVLSSILEKDFSNLEEVICYGNKVFLLIV